jgi:hypothetical protein
MDKEKHEFIESVEKYFKNCEGEQLEARKEEMIKIINVVFKYEGLFRMHKKISMNIIEVSKEENVGKVYRITKNGKDLGKWKIKKDFGNENFDFCSEDYEVLSDIYTTSEMVAMKFEEVK